MPTLPTVLSLSAIGLPPYSARGLSQTLTPIGQSANLRRSINGTLTNLADPNFQKYGSTISGDDQQPPALDMVWPGQELVVHCIQELAVRATEVPSEIPTETETVTELEELFGRPAVTGSVRQEGDYVFYRPILTMLVTGHDIDWAEWTVGVRWSISLEEK